MDESYFETFARKMISLSGKAKTHGMREFMLINDRLSTILTQHAGEMAFVQRSHFGGRCKGQRGRGAAGKIPVFGLLKRGGKVYTKVMSDASVATLPRLLSVSSSLTVLFILTAGEVIICWMLLISSTIASTIPNALSTSGITSTVSRIFGTGQSVIMHKFNGVPKAHFGLYLKECEWRFNNSDPTSQLLQLRQWVKAYLNELSRTAPCFLTI